MCAGGVGEESGQLIVCGSKQIVLESLKMDAVYKAEGHLPQASSRTRLIVPTAFAGIMRLQLVSQSRFWMHRATGTVSSKDDSLCRQYGS
jgi:hypothetical protein